MGKQEKTNSTIIEHLNTGADMVLLSLLWTVFSLPLVTLGMSSAALFHTAQLCFREEKGTVCRTFLKNIKESWRYALPLGAVITAADGILLTVISFSLNSADVILWMPFFTALFLLIFLLMIQIHLYPLIGHFTLDGKQLFVLVGRLIFSHPLKNIVLLTSLVLSITLAAAFPPLLMIIPTIYALVSAHFQMPVFHEFIRFPEDTPEQYDDEER